MEVLKYKVIKTKQQYKQYCKIVEQLVFDDKKNGQTEDEIELLTLLIEQWDKEHNSFLTVDPISLLRSLMKEQNLKAKDLAVILGVSKGLVSDILHYKKSLSKEIIRKLADHFKLSQEAFNRAYPLKLSAKATASQINAVR